MVDACVLPGGHEAGQVRRVGKEGEDHLEGVAQPLLGLEVEAHALL